MLQYVTLSVRPHCALCSVHYVVSMDRLWAMTVRRVVRPTRPSVRPHCLLRAYVRSVCYGMSLPTGALYDCHTSAVYVTV